MGQKLLIFVVSVFLLLMTSFVLLGPPINKQGAAPHFTASTKTSDYFKGALQKKAASSSSAYAGGQTFHTPYIPASTGNITAGRNVDEYVADLIAHTPYENREARFIEAARKLDENKHPDKAKELLEALVIDAASDGNRFSLEVLNILRAVYAEGDGPASYERLLSMLPDSFYQRESLVTAAVEDYERAGRLPQAFSLLYAEIDKDNSNIRLRWDLIKAYELAGDQESASQEMANVVQFQQDTFRLQEQARAEYEAACAAEGKGC